MRPYLVVCIQRERVHGSTLHRALPLRRRCAHMCLYPPLLCTRARRLCLFSLSSLRLPHMLLHIRPLSRAVSSTVRNEN